MTDHTSSGLGIVSLSLTANGREAELMINRPEKLNALNPSVLESLECRIVEIEATNASVVRLRTAGDKAFVAGADIATMQGMSVDQARAFAAYGAHVFERLSALGAIVIAEVQGFALGGGFELALASDIIIASHSARFGLPEVSLGLIPGFGGTQRLTRRIGYGKAIELIATGRTITAAEALACGIITAVTEPEDLRSRADATSQEILSRGGRAVAAAKLAVRSSQDLALSSGLGLEASLFSQCFSHPESTEGMAAFLEKRKPKF